LNLDNRLLDTWSQVPVGSNDLHNAKPTRRTVVTGGCAALLPLPAASAATNAAATTIEPSESEWLGLFCVISPARFGDNLEEWEEHLEWARSLPDVELLKDDLIDEAERMVGIKRAERERAKGGVLTPEEEGA
jgi:hypothetical protein